MTRRTTEVWLLIRAGDEKLARARIVRALRRSRGNIAAAGRLLQGVGRKAINVWIFRLGLEKELEAIRAETKWWRPAEREAERKRALSTRVDTTGKQRDRKGRTKVLDASRRVP